MTRPWGHAGSPPPLAHSRSLGTMPRMDQIPLWVLGLGALVLIGLIVVFFKIRQK